MGSIPLSELKSTNIELNQLQKSSSNQLWVLHVISVISVSEFSLKNKHATLQKVKSRKAEKILPDFKLIFSQFSNYQKKILRLSILRHQKQKYFENRYKLLTFLLKIESDSRSVVSLRGVEPTLHSTMYFGIYEKILTISYLRQPCIKLTEKY